MIFIDNKYTRIYNMIVERAKTRVLPLETYIEQHHIIPRSIGGNNSKENIVALTAREHFICHWLLPKMTEGKSRRSMSHALRMMLAVSPGRQENRYIPKPKKYELVKKLANKASKGRPCSPETREKIRQGNLNRNPPTDETRAKLSAAAKRRKGLTPEGRARVIAANKGRIVSKENKQQLREARARQVERQGDTMTVEARAKLSAAAKGRILTNEHKNKISMSTKLSWTDPERKKAASERRKGTVMSNETKQKLREACREKASTAPKPQLTCPHCDKSGGAPSMKRWHMDNCKNK